MNTHNSAYRQEREFMKFIFPALLFLILTFLFPFVYSFIISLCDSDSVLAGNNQFIGLKNYIAIFIMKPFWSSLSHTFVFVISTLVIELVFGFIIALLLDKNLKGTKILRLIYSLPLMIAPIVAGLQWRWLFADQYGIINAILKFFKINGPLWLTSSTGSRRAILIANIWLALPFDILVLLSGLSNLSQDLKEASTIDGASSIQTLFYIVLPQLKPTILVILVIRIADAFRIYDIIYVLTGGGPGGSTEVVSTYIYKQTFVFLRFGQGSAASLIIMAIIFTISLLLNKYLIYERA